MSDKKRAIKNKMIEYVENVLTLAEKEGKLDYIDVVISNHNGNLQMDYTLRERGRVY